MLSLDLDEAVRLPVFQIFSELAQRWWGAALGLGDMRERVLLGGHEASVNGEGRRDVPASAKTVRCAVEALRRRLTEQTEQRRTAAVHLPCPGGWTLSGAPIRAAGELGGFALCWNRLGASVDRYRLEDMLLLACAEIVTRVSLTGTGIVVQQPDFVPGLVGSSPAMQASYRLLEKIFPSDSTVLIQAESGTGKELVARAIHSRGPRKDKPFVAQNCSAFNDQLLESTLFGHLRGSFTGANRDQRGLFEVADSGTLFLDEIGDMSAALQVKLLRVLQEGTFLPVGAERPRSCDVRIIAATHRDLRKMIEQGAFREDLFYRVNVLCVELPPLRERVEDIPLLVDHFLTKHGGGDPPPRVAPDTIEAMQAHRWPGNVRELENEVERLVVLTSDAEIILPEHLSKRILYAASQRKLLRDAAGSAVGARTLRNALESVERELIYQSLRRTGWNKSRVARDLGISRSNLLLKVEKYGLERHGDGDSVA